MLQPIVKKNCQTTVQSWGFSISLIRSAMNSHSYPLMSFQTSHFLGSTHAVFKNKVGSEALVHRYFLCSALSAMLTLRRESDFIDNMIIRNPVVGSPTNIYYDKHLCVILLYILWRLDQTHWISSTLSSSLFNLRHISR